MPRLECNKLFEACEAVVEADSVEEILSQAATHAAAVHGLNEMDDATADTIKSVIEV